jgi:hypothetical protein
LCLPGAGAAPAPALPDDRTVLEERRIVDERQEELAHLTERVGVTPREAELILENDELVNDDLWTILPEQRFVSEDAEEEARKW